MALVELVLIVVAEAYKSCRLCKADRLELYQTRGSVPEIHAASGGSSSTSVTPSVTRSDGSAKQPFRIMKLLLVSWRYRQVGSLVQACVQAAPEKKPLLMVCRAGHPLGCV